MNAVAAIFWNRDESRLRAGWRLIVQLLVMILVCAIWQFSLPGRAGVATLSSFGTLFLSMLIIAFARRVLDRRTVVELGLRLDRGWWLEFLAGFVLGGALIGGVFACEWRVGWIAIVPAAAEPSTPPAPLFAGVLIFIYYVAVGVFEETYFRGYLLRNLADGLSCRWLRESGELILAAGVTAIVFAAAHVFSPTSTRLSEINTLLAGILLAYMVLARRNLAAAIGFHLGWNYLQGGVFGFPVSGGLAVEQSWLAIDQGGPDVWTGGAYGPEGGLLGTLAFLVGWLAIAMHQMIWGRLAQKRIANEG